MRAIATSKRKHITILQAESTNQANTQFNSSLSVSKYPLYNLYRKQGNNAQYYGNDQGLRVTWVCGTCLQNKRCFPIYESYCTYLFTESEWSDENIMDYKRCVSAYALSLPSSGIDFLSFPSGNLKLEKLELPWKQYFESQNSGMHEPTAQQFLQKTDCFWSPWFQ